MNRQKSIILGVVLLCGLLATTALAAGEPSIDWSVISGEGGHLQSGSIRLDGSLGQAVTGEISSGSF